MRVQRSHIKTNYKAGGNLEITSVKLNEDSVTIKGEGFPASEKKSLILSVEPLGTDKSQAVKEFTLTDNEITFNITPLNLKPDCYTVDVKNGDEAAVTSKDTFAFVPTLHLDSAIRSGHHVTVLGSGFIDLTKCGAPLKFQARRIGNAAGENDRNISNLRIESEEKAIFDLPSASKNVRWRLTVSLGKDKTAETDVR